MSELKKHPPYLEDVTPRRSRDVDDWWMLPAGLGLLALILLVLTAAFVFTVRCAWEAAG